MRDSGRQIEEEADGIEREISPRVWRKMTTEACCMGLASRHCYLSIARQVHVSVCMCKGMCMYTDQCVSGCYVCVRVFLCVFIWAHIPYNQQAPCVFSKPIKSHSFANDGPAEV